MTPEHVLHLVAAWTVAGFACVVFISFAAWLAVQLVLMVWEA
jgi:hypothetical protein